MLTEEAKVNVVQARFIAYHYSVLLAFGVYRHF